MQTVWYHLHYYKAFLVGAWDNMSPMQYGFVLAAIGVTGWMLMKHGPSG
jgi:hypothetical protein